MNMSELERRADEIMSGASEPPYEPGYRLHHGRRTAALCAQIAETENIDCDRDILHAGALLHDIGKFACPEGVGHGPHGAGIFLDKFAGIAPRADLEAVAKLIAHHYDRPNSKWFEGKAKPSWPPDILALQDADVLDHFGMPGIWLAMHWAMHRHLSPAKTAENWFESDYMNGWRTEAARSLNFNCSRTLLASRIAEMDDFFRRLV